MKITTDLVAVGGLAIALIVGVVMGAPAELLTGIAGGLSGYLSKTAVNHFENPHEIARENKGEK
ncbi:hypothetical protein [Selenomonas ruminantium]|uniref:hypothetical protein n=1 Tax=Selenomonas ruminantium TaxID=971 RepID=UPI0004054936|nr:hypothetical protein [Selenomonas ruminantium]